MGSIQPMPQEAAPPLARGGSGVSLQSVSCVLDHVPAVRELDLTVREGEFLALVGPSGAGKTTILRILAGLEPRHAGRVLIGGRDVTDVPARARNVGFVFQSYALFPHMTVAQNVAFGLSVRPRRHRPDRRVIAAQVAELLELVQVTPLAGRRPAQLSGGQRQRVALARALAIEPRVLLLDEPFGALDPLIRHDIRTWLRGLHDRLGLTSILVTHDREEALDIADRLVVLRDGRLVQLGTPRELEDRPTDPFVHQFLGETRHFEATARAGRISLHYPWADAVAPARFHGPDGPVLLSIRPYEIVLREVPQGAVPPGSAAQGSVATILSVRRRGPFNAYQITAGVDGQEVAEVLRPASEPAWAPGASCRLDLSMGKLFARSSGATT